MAESIPSMAGEQEALRETLVRSRTKRVALTWVRYTGWTLVSVGLFLIGFVLHQLFVTDFLADRAQGGLRNELALRSETQAEVVPFDPVTGAIGDPVGSVEGSGLVDPGTGATTGGVGDPSTTPSEFNVPGTDKFLLREPTPDRGEAVGRVRVPAVGLSWVVVEGVSFADLRSGAGHMPTTPLPGQPGNAVVSGHRTTWGAPFNEFDQLEPNDQIFWDSPVIGTHMYVVRETMVVRPTDLWVTGEREGAWLTLTTCHPEFSASQRLIVFAELVDGPNAPVILGET